MRIRIYAIVLVLLIILPLAARAQTVTELQAQLAALLAQVAELQKLQQSVSMPVTSGSACPAFTRTLQKGMSGPDVTELQLFLKSRGFLEAEASGYFGSLTEAAVQAFQAAGGVVSSGDAASTGYGIVGPKTRAAIVAACATKSADVPRSCPAPQQPAGSCTSAWLPVSDEGGCHIGWQCAKDSAPAGGPPVVESIGGPLQLFIGEVGVWNVVARDPDGGALVYAVTWGDEGSENLLQLLAGYSAPTFVPSPKLMHSFTRGGTYTPTVMVRDGAGEETTSTFTISIVPRPASTSPAAILSPGIGSCYFNGINYPQGTETEGYTIGDLCLATGGICQQRSAYIPKFKCAAAVWQPVLTNPYSNLPTYAHTVGSTCPSDGAFKQVVVSPGDQLCRGLLCAISKTYTPIQLRCQYVSWVDWGAFSAGATTTTVCAEPTPCEYVFGSNGRACAAKELGVCKAAPYQNHPANQN